jgi:hypothetical protein
MQHDRKRLHQRRHTEVDACRQANQGTRGDEDLVRHTAVAAHPVHHARPGYTQVVVAADARFTATARRKGLHRHGRAVLRRAGHLVTQYDVAHEAGVHHVKIAAADPCDADLDAHTFPGRHRSLHHLDALTLSTYGSHPTKVDQPDHPGFATVTIRLPIVFTA